MGKYSVEEIIENFGQLRLEELPAITKELRKLLDEEPGPPAGAAVPVGPAQPTLSGSAAKKPGEA